MFRHMARIVLASVPWAVASERSVTVGGVKIGGGAPVSSSR